MAERATALECLRELVRLAVVLERGRVVDPVAEGTVAVPGEPWVDAQGPAVGAAGRPGLRGIGDLGLAAVVADDGPRARVRAVGEGDVGDVDGRALVGPRRRVVGVAAGFPGPAERAAGTRERR